MAAMSQEPQVIVLGQATARGVAQHRQFIALYDRNELPSHDCRTSICQSASPAVLEARLRRDTGRRLTGAPLDSGRRCAEQMSALSPNRTLH